MVFPKINILFKSVASTAVKRGNKGIMYAILRDASMGEGTAYEMVSAADIHSIFSDYNKEQLQMIFQGYDCSAQSHRLCTA